MTTQGHRFVSDTVGRLSFHVGPVVSNIRAFELRFQQRVAYSSFGQTEALYDCFFAPLTFCE